MLLGSAALVILEASPSCCCPEARSEASDAELVSVDGEEQVRLRQTSDSGAHVADRAEADYQGLSGEERPEAERAVYYELLPSSFVSESFFLVAGPAPAAAASSR